MRSFVATILVLLASCASGSFGPPPEFSWHPQGELLPATRTAAQQLQIPTSGIAARATGELMPGDRVSFAVELDQAGVRKQWLLLLTVAKPARGGLIHLPRPVQIKLGSGRVMSLLSPLTEADLQISGPYGNAERPRTKVSSIQLHETFLRYGFARTSEIGIREKLDFGTETAEQRLSKEEFERHLVGYVALWSFLAIVQEESALAEILWAVVDTPSPLAVLFSGFAITLGIHPRFAAAQPAATVLRETAEPWPGFKVPIDLTANDTPALRCELAVTDPQRPLTACAGIVSLQAVNPSDPAKKLRIWVLAAELGPAKPTSR